MSAHYNLDTIAGLVLEVRTLDDGCEPVYEATIGGVLVRADSLPLLLEAALEEPVSC